MAQDGTGPLISYLLDHSTGSLSFQAHWLWDFREYR